MAPNQDVHALRPFLPLTCDVVVHTHAVPGRVRLISAYIPLIDKDCCGRWRFWGTEELRTPGIELHMEYDIEWLDDSLPDLSILRARKEAFDVIMLTAVWMHLDEVQRCRAMPVIASLLSATGIIIMSLRHGPVPNGRRMFEVTEAETIELAALQGLQLVLNIRTQSVSVENRIADVNWTRLAFRR